MAEFDFNSENKVLNFSFETKKNIIKVLGVGGGGGNAVGHMYEYGIKDVDFIVANNHQQGHEIKETSTALEAWGLTEEEQAVETKKARKAQLIAQLDDIDLKTIRPLRAIQAADFTDEDVAKLQALEQQAEQIRAELQNL